MQKHQRSDLEKAWAAKRARTHCARGHPIPPFTGKIRVCLACDKYTRMLRDARPGGGLREATFKRAVNALKAGTPISHIGGLVNGKYVKGLFICRPKHLKLYCAANPTVGRPVVRLIARNSTIALNEVRLLGTRTRWAHKYVPPTQIDSTETDVDLAIRLAVSRMKREYREEMLQILWVAVLEGRLKLGQIGLRAAEFLRSYRRENEHSVEADNGNVSLSTPRYDEGKESWQDFTTQDQALWGQNSKWLYSK